VEVLVSTETVKACIEDKEKTKGLRDVIAQGTSEYGMQTFDQSLYFLLQEGLITVEEALKRATNVGEFRLRLEGIHSTAEAARTNMSRGMALSSGPGREAGIVPPPRPVPPPPVLPGRKPEPPPGEVKITLAR
jgi:twitching motility protein PilT